MCRLKVSGAFYEDFKGPKIAKLELNGALGKPTSIVTADSESLEDFMRLVQSAVTTVLGSSAGSDQPLIEAGLDSLGLLPNMRLST